MDSGQSQQQGATAATNGQNGTSQASAPPPGGGPQQGPPPGRPQQAPPPKKRRAPPLPVLVVAAIVIIAALIWGVRFLAYATTHQSTDDAMVESDTVVVTPKISERVDRINTDTNQYVRRGQILIVLDSRDERTRLAQAQASIAAQNAQVAAAEQNVQLTRAQQVAQNEQNSGSITSARASVNNAADQTASARRQIAVSRSEVTTSQAQLAVAQAAVPGTREALRRAQNDYDRTAALVRTGDLSQSQLDAERSSLATARSNYEQALNNVAAGQSSIASAQARVTAAIASASAAAAQIGNQQGAVTTANGKLAESATPYRVTAQQAQATAAQAQLGSLGESLRNAQDQLSYTVIRSPIDGYVGEKNVEIGATVAPGQALLDIVPATGIYITANYKETQIGKMQINDPVDVHVDAYPGADFQGRVVTLGPASQNEFSLVPAQNATGNFVKVTQRIPIRVIVDHVPRNMPLRPGMSVETSVLIQK